MHLLHHISSFHLTRMLAAILLISLLAIPCLAEEAAPYSYEWFMQPDDSVPTKACVHIYSQSAVPAKLTYDPAFDAQYVWKLQFIFEEVTGIPFSIEKLCQVTFGQDNIVRSINDYSADELDAFLPSATVERNNTMGFNINIIPGGGATAFGIAVEGTDALGNRLTFTCLVPLSYEVNEALTRAHFASGASMEDGKPYIAITTEQNPIPQIYNPDFAGDYGWKWMYSIENVTDESFTVSRIVEAFLIGENVVHFSEYKQEQFANWDVSPEFVKGNPFIGGSGANAQQGFDELGLLVEGVDKDGAKMVFAALIPFSKERPQE